MAAPMVEGADQDRARREVAQRVYAAEFNQAKHTFKESGDRSPSFVISPFGAKVNRLLAVGVLTSVEAAGQGAGNYKAQIVDPTGTFYLWAGQFEPEAAAQLADIHPPAIVAVVGKSRARETDTGATYVSIRPETIRVVQKADRDAWVLETAKHTMVRLDAMREALKLEQPTVEKLVELGFPKDVSEGVVKAIEHYGKPQLAEHAQLVRDALETLLPGGADKIAAEPSFAPAAASYTPTTPAAQPAPRAVAAPAAKPESPHKELVLGFVESLDDGKGAPWEDIVAAAAKKNVREEAVEEALNALMDDGLIYEPVLGRLKKT
ncbi:MAG TPA: hypothetical protein VFH78_06030 [Candidatus Thermoplasmatota archaeon]|nr:hypothetical protein [Candidatus Thermoplasmatota archaeon]